MNFRAALMNSGSFCLFFISSHTLVLRFIICFMTRGYLKGRIVVIGKYYGVVRLSEMVII